MKPPTESASGDLDIPVHLLFIQLLSSLAKVHQLYELFNGNIIYRAQKRYQAHQSLTYSLSPLGVSAKEQNMHCYGLMGVARSNLHRFHIWKQ